MMQLAQIFIALLMLPLMDGRPLQQALTLFSRHQPLDT